MEQLIHARTSESRPFENLPQEKLEELRTRVDLELDPFKKQLEETLELIKVNRNFRFELDMEDAIRKTGVVK